MYYSKAVSYFSFRGSDAEDDDEWEDVEDDSDEKDSCCNDYDSEGPLSDDGVNGQGKEFLFMQEETRSRFTEYSMTSSVMRRNEQLTLLDDRFEKVKQLRNVTVKRKGAKRFFGSSHTVVSCMPVQILPAFGRWGLKQPLPADTPHLILCALSGLC